ncbi:MAG: DUF418 domain-containing protein, partial [Acidobacteriota bacterium]
AAAVAEILAAFGVEEEDPGELTWDALERRAWTEGPAALTLGVRAGQYLIWLGLSSIISFNWHVLALFCLGAAAMKLELLGADRRSLHGRLAALGVTAGLLLEAAAVVLWLRTGFSPGAVDALATVLHEVGSLVLAAGYLGAVLWLVHRAAGRPPGPIQTPLAAVGRTALTSYLGQSAVFNLLFPFWGLGLWSRLDRPTLIALSAVIFLAQAAVATLWLRRYAMGPCEWLWRWGTYGARPPLRLP